MNKIKVTLKEETTRCYKGDQPCLTCGAVEILRLQLTVEEVPGRVVHVSAVGMGSREGFVCTACIPKLHEDPDMDVIDEVGKKGKEQ